MASPVPSLELLGAINSLWNKLSVRQWMAKLPFMCAPFMKSMLGLPLTPNVDAADICEYLGGLSSMYPIIAHFYLDPHVCNKPPSPMESLKDNAHFKLLKAAMLTAASLTGTPLICNGGGKDSWLFCCKLKNHAFWAICCKEERCPKRRWLYQPGQGWASYRRKIKIKEDPDYPSTHQRWSLYLFLSS